MIKYLNYYILLLNKKNVDKERQKPKQNTTTQKYLSRGINNKQILYNIKRLKYLKHTRREELNSVMDKT